MRIFVSRPRSAQRHHRRDQQHGREGGEVERPLHEHRDHQDQQGAGDVERDQHVEHVGPQLRCRGNAACVPGPLRIADAGQHIAQRVGNRHRIALPLTSLP